MICADKFREVPMGGKAGSPDRCALSISFTIGNCRDYITTFL